MPLIDAEGVIEPVIVDVNESREDVGLIDAITDEEPDREGRLE